MKHWFTSDLHWHHKNIIKYSNRPFSSVEDMNEKMIAKWNDNVASNDIVYSLGDFAFGNYEQIWDIISHLNGKIHMITGNHDQTILKNRERLLSSRLVEEITPYKEITLDGQFICLFHYGCRVWNKSHHGSWLLYGHTHDTLPPFGRSVDVGVDSTAILGHAPYRPFSFDEIKQFMENRPIEL